MDLADSRAASQEGKQAKIAALEVRHKRLIEGIYGTLARRNNLAAQRLPADFLEARVQLLVTSADVAALVDTLEAMGKIDRVDYVMRCVARLEKIAGIIERPA